MSKKLKPIPQFKDEQEEADFWMTHDTTEYLDWDKAQSFVFPNLKPSSKLISLRLPVSVIENARIEANKRDMPYQSLIKQILYWTFVQNGLDVDKSKEVPGPFFQDFSVSKRKITSVDKSDRK
jgi:predicted DNA binding CopG/RHH family protein